MKKITQDTVKLQTKDLQRFLEDWKQKAKKKSLEDGTDQRAYSLK
jgi:hypothetical protein